MDTLHFCKYFPIHFNWSLIDVEHWRCISGISCFIQARSQLCGYQLTSNVQSYWGRPSNRTCAKCRFRTFLQNMCWHETVTAFQISYFFLFSLYIPSHAVYWGIILVPFNFDPLAQTYATFNSTNFEVKGQNMRLGTWYPYLNAMSSVCALPGVLSGCSRTSWYFWSSAFDIICGWWWLKRVRVSCPQ